MNQNEINQLNDEQLIWTCVEPIVLQVRGKDPLTKAQVMKQLNEAQRALFLFQVMYGHAHHGMALFFQQIDYIAESVDFWAALKSTMRYFDDTEMMNLIGKMEVAYEAQKNGNDFEAFLDELDQLYKGRLPATLNLIGSYIRNNPAEFIGLED